MAASMKTICLCILRKPCLFNSSRRNIFNSPISSYTKNRFTHHSTERHPNQRIHQKPDTAHLLLRHSALSLSKLFPCRVYSTEVDADAQVNADDSEEFDVLYSKIIVEVKGHDSSVLQSYKTFVCRAAEHLEIKIAQVQQPKYHVFRQSVLSSVHIYKKHQTQYEQRTHFKVFEFINLTGSTANTFLEYIQRNLPEGTAMKVTRHQIEPIPKHLKPPQQKENQIES